jgi:hypothetical protein
LICIEITLIGWKNAKLHCANGLKPVGLSRAGPATWVGGPTRQKQGMTLGHSGAGGGGRFWQADTGGGWGTGVVAGGGVVDRFEAKMRSKGGLIGAIHGGAYG